MINFKSVKQNLINIILSLGLFIILGGIMVETVYAMGQTGGGGGQGGGLTAFLPLILIVVVFYFLLIRP
ncbi:MAG TPA: hypothetical protein VF369_09085, partial [candidate division Zixibacteria bacterium]